MPEALFLFVSLFVLGTIVGSFLNVVGLRYRSGLGLGGRSVCHSCGRTLSWWELLPVVSFFILRRRCSSCGTKISWQYPLVELWTGLLFITVPIIILPVFCIYTVILIYDLRHKIIPDGLVYASVVLALVYRFYVGGNTLDWLIGPILFVLFGLGWALSKGKALGLGDAKLALSLGLLLGAAYGLSAMALAFWIGTAVTLPFVLLPVVFSRIFPEKRLTIKSEIPFAPFLIIGAWVSLLFRFDIFHVLSFQ